MFRRCFPMFAFVALLFAFTAPSRGQSTPPPQWVGTWATSPMVAEGFNLRMLAGVTLREIAHISVGGQQVRIRFTNEFGA